MTNTASALSTEEVSALMEELGDAGEANLPAVQSYALGQAVRPTPRLSGLERMGERLARAARDLIEPMARVKTIVTNEVLETRIFSDWRADLPMFTSLSLYRLRPLKGSMLLVVEPQFIADMVNAFYGGSGSSAPPKGPELSAGEERLLTRLTDALIPSLIDSWAEVAPLEPTLAARETCGAHASLVRLDESVVIQRLSVAPQGMRPSTIQIVYPLAMLRPLEEQLSGKVHEDMSSTDPEWRYRLAAALDNVQLPVRSVLARPELSVAQLMALKPGDVIPITLEPTVPLLVATKLVAEGTIGEQEGRAALMIESVGKGKNR